MYDVGNTDIIFLNKSYMKYTFTVHVHGIVDRSTHYAKYNSLSFSFSLVQPSAPCELVKHTVLWVEETSKRKKLIEFLKDGKRLRFVEWHAMLLS